MIEIPKLIKNKIQRVNRLRIEQTMVCNEVFDWFKKQGIDTTESGFIDVIGAKILYGEFTDSDWWDYLNGRRK